MYAEVTFLRGRQNTPCSWDEERFPYRGMNFPFGEQDPALSCTGDQRAGSFFYGTQAKKNYADYSFSLQEEWCIFV
jgi:hypothetical protein